MAKKKVVKEEKVEFESKEFEHLTILTVKNPVRSPSGGIDMEVTLKDLGTIPFHATAEDEEEHGKWLFEEAEKGTFGTVGEYERPLPTKEDLQKMLDKILPDVVLGLATEQELDLARNLRKQIKLME